MTTSPDLFCWHDTSPVPPIPDYKLRTEAQNFLRLHGGSCSVLADSQLGYAFAGLALIGEVRVQLSATPGYVDVYSRDFKSGRQG